MPVKSKSQLRFFQACKDKSFRQKSKRKCPPLSVINEFLAETKRTPKKEKA